MNRLGTLPFEKVVQFVLGLAVSAVQPSPVGQLIIDLLFFFILILKQKKEQQLVKRNGPKRACLTAEERAKVRAGCPIRLTDVEGGPN